MRCVRALLIGQLMTEASFLDSPIGASLLGGPPEKIEQKHFFGVPHVGPLSVADPPDFVRVPRQG